MQVSTLAGSGTGGWGDGQGTQAHFHYPYGVAVDGDGNIIVADSSSHRIRKIAAGLAPPLPRAPPQLPSVHMARMEALLDDESCSDVSFVVGDARIHAHSIILKTQSDYFRAMLASGFREGGGGGGGGEEPEDRPAKKARVSGQGAGTNDIIIGNTTPEAFKALLRYLYTDELRFADELLVDVMRKAKEISLERVYNHCMRQVAGKMSVHNAVGWFVEADEHGLEDVRAAAFGFLARNLAQVKRQASETLEMLADKPRLTMQLMLEQARVLELARAANPRP